MSVVRSKLEHRTILDFSKGKLSKNLVKNSLRQVDVLDCVSAPGVHKLIVNRIKVGMYMIQLWFSDRDTSRNRRKLKEYGKFNIHIYEECASGDYRLIRLNRDVRFNNQYWASLNKKSGLMANSLTDAIVHCNRLSRLKAFL